MYTTLHTDDHGQEWRLDADRMTWHIFRKDGVRFVFAGDVLRDESDEPADAIARLRTDEDWGEIDDDDEE